MSRLRSLIAACLVVWIISLIAEAFGLGRDDTDPPSGRSGLGLYIDHRTGCHYVSAWLFGITPRLDASGRQICDAPSTRPIPSQGGKEPHHG